MNVTSGALEKMRSRIEKACISAARDVSEVTLLAVSKTHSASAVLALYRQGQVCFGENRLQEAIRKQAETAESGIEWHFIGPVQSNKAREIAINFDWVQSVDRAKILERLSTNRPGSLEPLNICLQVNIDAEAQKSGLALDEVAALAERAEQVPRIRLRGLMCIPRFGADEAATRASFLRMRGLYEDLRSAGHALDTLSMGMSADLELAIAEGSTMVRVGTDLFGPRQPAEVNH